MKNLLLPLFFLCAFQLYGQSEPELKFSGLKVSEAYLTLGGLEVGSNELPYNKKTYMYFEGLEGVNLKSGRVFIGCQMKVFNSKGELVLDFEDLFNYADAEGFAPEAISTFTVSLIISNELVRGESYDWWVRIWDKNGKGYFEANYPFKVGPPLDMTGELGITKTPKGLDSHQIFMMEGWEMVNYPIFDPGSQIDLYVYGIEGLTNRNGRSHLGISLKVADKEGKKVLEYFDMFTQASPRGIPAHEARDMRIPLDLVDPVEPGKNYDYFVRIWDKFGPRELFIQGELRTSGDPVTTTKNPGVNQDPGQLISGMSLPSETRIALVIGIKDYKNVPPLQNTLNDAMDMAAALKKKGFQVIEVYDPQTKFEIRDAAIEFNRALYNQDDGVGLVYYAGHGMQVDGVNYIIPGGADLQIKADIEMQCMNMDYVLRAMEETGCKLNIIILDACRNNPFRTFSRSAEQGLSMIAAPKGSYIVYATKPGAVASDGTGRNGLFTSKLLKYIGIPGLNIEQVFKNVAAEVSRDSNDVQRPWISSDYTGDFFFSPNN